MLMLIGINCDEVGIDFLMNNIVRVKVFKGVEQVDLNIFSFTVINTLRENF